MVRKTISDAPLPRKGPLPQDFQDALSIIFDQKPLELETDKTKQPDPNNDVDSEIVSMQIVDEQSQHTLDIYQTPFPLTGVQPPEADLSFAEDVDIPDPLPLPLAIPPPPPPPIEEEDAVKSSKKSKPSKDVDEDESVAAKKVEDSVLMDDLAMLGIDADDLAAQCI